jgi:sugar transferase (PEP-CTERM/EpsH1 system associated)
MRVLYLCHRVPYAPNRGDRIRAFHTLRCLRAQGVDVHLVALAHDREEAGRAAGLDDLVSSADVVQVPYLSNRIRATAALTGGRPLTHVLLDSGALRPVLERAVAGFDPDVVLAYCSGMARFALEHPLSAIPFVLDMVDVDSEKWTALAGQSYWPLSAVYSREARVLRQFEARAAASARRTLVVNERERASMRVVAREGAIDVVSNGIDLAYFRPPGPVVRNPEVVFSGVFDYAPNAAGAMWLLREVWPLVRSRRPDATLTFAGSNPSRELRSATARDASITVSGAVPDLRPFLWRSRVSAAPVFVARGLQNKVLEALAAGLPVVTTPAVASGLPAAIGAVCDVSDDPAAFATALLERLASTDTLSFESLLTPYSWEASLSRLPTLLAHPAEA